MENLGKRTVQSHVIEMLAGLHDVRSPLCLVDLHPALTEELPAELQCPQIYTTDDEISMLNCKYIIYHWLGGVNVFFIAVFTAVENMSPSADQSINPSIYFEHLAHLIQQQWLVVLFTTAPVNAV